MADPAGGARAAAQGAGGGLDRAAPLVKPGGRIAYITCSVLTEENDGQVRDFVSRTSAFASIHPADVELLAPAVGRPLREAAIVSAEGLLMTPRRTGTDGFYVAVLERKA